MTKLRKRSTHNMQLCALDRKYYDNENVLI